MGPLSESGELFSHRSECELFIDAAREGLGARIDVPVFERVCIFGTDSCSIAGEILVDAADEMSSRPLTCVRDDRIPGWVDSGTLAVLVLYDGGCPGLDGLAEGLRDRGCAILAITSGGTICNILHPSETVLMPVGLEGHEAMGYALGVLSAIIQSSGQFPAGDALSVALDAVSGRSDRIPEEAERIAGFLRGNVGAFYSTSDVHACSVAFREAMSDSGLLSFVGELPEFDHNELVGWSDPNAHAPELRMVVLRGRSGSDLVNTIVGCMLEVLRENGRDVLEVDIGAGPTMERNIFGLLLGLEVSDIMGVRA